jgi:hypothetical protein
MKTTTTKPATGKAKPKPKPMPNIRGKKPPAPGTTGKRKERPLSVRHERFCEFIAAGESQTDAYIHAGYNVGRLEARKLAAKLATKSDIILKIDAIRGKTRAKLDMKREDLARHLMAAVMTPIGEIDGRSPLCAEMTEDIIGGGNRGKLMRGKAPSGNEVVEETVVRRRVKSIGKIEAARLLCEMMGWKEPEKITVDAGPNTLEAIRERARFFKSPLNRRHAEG